MPGSTLMYGSSFCIVTRRPRDLQQPPERRGGEPLAEARCHATGHEDVLRHDPAFSHDLPCDDTKTDRRRPYHVVPRSSCTATVPPSMAETSSVEQADRGVLTPGRGRRVPALAHGRAGARRGHRGAAAPRALCHPIARVRRRRVRVVGARHAARRPALPRRVLEPGPGVPSPGLDRRPARVPHPRRAAAPQRRVRRAGDDRGVLLRAARHDARRTRCSRPAS